MGKFPAIQVQRSKYADKVVAGETALTGEQLKTGIEGAQPKLTSSSVNDGTPDKVLAFDAQGNLIKGSVGGGGTKLYKHHIVLSNYFDKLYSYNVNEDGTITVTNRTAAYAEKSIEVISTREETFINIELLRNSTYFIYIQSGAFGTNNYYDVVIYTNSNDNKTYVNCRDQKGGIVYGYYNGIMNITSDTVIEL